MGEREREYREKKKEQESATIDQAAPYFRQGKSWQSQGHDKPKGFQVWLHFSKLDIVVVVKATPPSKHKIQFI